MRKRGSITVFLTLILVLLFSLVLTTLEAARIAGGRAYIQMLSVMAGDSARALYYYPLFKEYGLLGIVAADDAGYFSDEKLDDAIKEDLVYALAGLRGGLLSYAEPAVQITETKTLLSNNAESFLSQIREQAVLEGAKDLLTEMLSKKDLNDAVYASQMYQKQEETLVQTRTVTQEILELMMLVDGVVTNEDGLCFDEEGKLKTKEIFVKRFCSLTEEELKEKYGNEEVYMAVRGNFCDLSSFAESLHELLNRGAEVQAEIAVCDLELQGYKERREEIANKLTEKLSEEEEKVLLAEAKILAERIKVVAGHRDELIEWLDIAMMDMEEQYESLRKELSRIVPLLAQTKDVLSGLESKQLGAQISVKAYEEYLKELKEEVSEELYAVFWDELQRLKLYAGLSEEGCNVSKMRQTIEENELLLKEIGLPEFSGRCLYEMSRVVRNVADRIGEYSAEGLWFVYGEVNAVPSSQGNLGRMLDRLATGSVLSFVGLTEDEISKGCLAGQSLPSDGAMAEGLQTQLFRCFEEVSALFQEKGILGVLGEGADKAADFLSLEWYAGEYFGSFGSVQPGRKLLYEREYLLFGDRTDKGNLFFTILYLIAVRSVFSMVTILKDATKMSQLDMFAAGVAGFTGIPVLISAVKYGTLLLWAMEEALVEVSVLLEGKKVPLISADGKIEFSEMFLFGKEMVQQKAKSWKEVPTGLSYSEYLTFLSLLKNTQRKAYRCLDLIQENIRYRYNDTFRIRNVVTGFSFQVQTMLDAKVNTELWKEENYEIMVREAVAF